MQKDSTESFPRSTMALSRAKRKMILMALRFIFQLILADEEQFANRQLWKNLLRTCRENLRDGENGGQRVQDWGRRESASK
jgi:superfamily I DNA and/or RNA helicase